MCRDGVIFAADQSPLITSLPAMSGLQSQTSRRDLQFKRTTSMPPELVVDWEEVQATLDALDPQFADPRFDPLKHALRLLGSITAEEELNEVRLQATLHVHYVIEHDLA